MDKAVRDELTASTLIQSQKQPKIHNKIIKSTTLTTKLCPDCKIEKSITKFYKNKSKKDGLDSYCINCSKKYMSNYRKINKSKIDRIHAKYRKNNRKNINKRHKEFQKTHKISRNIYLRNKRKNNINFKIVLNLRTRIAHALRGETKSESTIRLLGCSINFLRKHLESKFKPGMSWDNRNKWHIDHIRPCASFDLLKRGEQFKCFHYTNLQPLWIEDNLLKGDKWNG